MFRNKMTCKAPLTSYPNHYNSLCPPFQNPISVPAAYKQKCLKQAFILLSAPVTVVFKYPTATNSL